MFGWLKRVFTAGGRLGAKGGHTKLIAVGYWCGEDEWNSKYPDPTRLVGSGLPDTERQSIVRYLKEGKKFAGALGYSFCRFGCGIPDENMGCWECTDGKWEWPEGLYHYVESHDVQLPPEFISWIRENGHVVPTQIRVGEFEMFDELNFVIPQDISVDKEFWLRWGKKNERGESSIKGRI